MLDGRWKMLFFVQLLASMYKDSYQFFAVFIYTFKLFIVYIIISMKLMM